jgi:S1-C subfamily serine protease
MFYHDNNTSVPAAPAAGETGTARRRLARFGAKSALVLALAGTTIGGGVVGSAMTAAALTPPAAAAATRAQAAPAASVAGTVYQSAKSSMVEILVSGPTNRYGMTQSGSGSGIIIDARGYVLTNNHVVDGASSIQVAFSDGTDRTAQVVGTDSGNDLALIKVELPAGAAVATLGDSDQVQVGDTAIAIGSPFGLNQTVTQGIISAVHRDWQPDGGTIQRDMLQTDAPINPGNSGGALLDTSGQVIGITTAIESPVRGSVGVGFAVPINTAKRLLPQLEAGKQLAPVWLGISGQELTPDVAQAQGLSTQSGVLVAEVVDGGPAAGAGLQANDIITAIDGSTIASFDQLSAQISAHQAGDKISITITRGGQERTLTATLQSRPSTTQ